MTVPLRRVHLWTWLLLAVVLAAAFATSLSRRRDTTPVNAGLHWERLR